MVKSEGRFSVPEASLLYEGNRTMIRNWKEIEDTLRREGAHILKYLTRELATAGTITNLRATLQGKFPTSQVNGVIIRYAKDFVICSACKRPDTEMVILYQILFVIHFGKSCQQVLTAFTITTQNILKIMVVCITGLR